MQHLEKHTNIAVFVDLTTRKSLPKKASIYTNDSNKNNLEKYLKQKKQVVTNIHRVPELYAIYAKCKEKISHYSRSKIPGIATTRLISYKWDGYKLNKWETITVNYMIGRIV